MSVESTSGWHSPPPALPRVIGHRGAAAAAPENTLASLAKAKALGAAWVEFDVKLTADGVPVLMHDDTLGRTTDGRGAVAAATLAEIRALDAGAWFGAAFRGERVPTLAEALALCAELDLGINVEIKPAPGRADATARAVIAVLRARWPADRPPPLISSFTHACLETARVLVPAWPRGYLATRLPADWAWELERYACATLHLSQRWLRTRQLRRLAAAGVPVLVFTVNDPVRARTLLAAGARAVFTDRVGEVAAAVV